MLVSTDMTISGMFFHCLKMSYEWADSSESCQFHDFIFAFLHTCFMDDLFHFPGFFLVHYCYPIEIDLNMHPVRILDQLCMKTKKAAPVCEYTEKD